MNKLFAILILVLMLPGVGVGQMFNIGLKPPFGQAELGLPHSIMKNLDLFLLFNEGSGGIIADYSGHEFRTKSSGDMNWVSTKHGFALSLNITDSQLWLADAPSFQLQGSFTIMTLAYIHNLTNSVVLTTKTDAAIGSYYFYVKDDGTYRFLASSTGVGWDTFTGTAGGVVTTGSWYFFTVINIAATSNTIYLGTTQKAQDNAIIVPTISSDPIRFGRHVTNNFYGGLIYDYLMIWNRAITLDELDYMYKWGYSRLIKRKRRTAGRHAALFAAAATPIEDPPYLNQPLIFSKKKGKDRVKWVK